MSLIKLPANFKFSVAFALFAMTGLARAQVVSQSFQNSSAPGWTFSGSGTYTPTLTSGVSDPTGSGWLQLTNNTGNQATSAVYNSSFNSAGATVYANFNYQMYGGANGTTLGGDGLTFFLYDATQTFSVGAYGGSLGYAQKTLAGGGGADINGMNGGYLAVGLDAYGNFSSGSEGRVGGYNGATSAVTESLGVRGPGSGLNGYAYLGGSGTLATPLDSAARPATTNTVQILLTATNQLTVTLQTGGTSPQTVLQMDLSGYTRPNLLGFGFTAGSGGATDFININNLNITTVAASLWSNGNGNSQWGTNTNWNPTVVPSTGADILFDNTYVSSNQTIDTVANRNVRSLSFDAPFNYTLNNNTLTFNNQGVAGFSGIAVTQTHGTGTDTVNSNLVLNNAINIRNNSTGALNVNGAIATNGNTLTLDGTGANTALSGVISGTGALIKNDAGTATLSGASTYTGGTTLNNGTLNANNNTALGTAGVTLAGGTLGSINNSTLANAIALTGNAGLSGLTTSGALTQTGGSYTLNLANATQSGNVALSNTSTAQTLTVQVDSGTSAISGVIANGGAGAGNLTKTGSGTLVLSGANTYTGTTTISTGALQLGGNDRLANASSVSLGASGTLDLNGFSDKVGTLTAAGGATLDFGAASGANTFVFGNYVAPSSGVLVVNNWESGLDKFATTVASQNVSTIYISGYGVAQEAGSASAMGGSYGNAYLLTPVTVASKEWDGSSSSSWNTSNNWTSPTKPSTTQIAVFNTLGVAQPNVTLNGANTIAGVQFGSGATVGYTITGSNTLTLTGSVPYIQQQSAYNQTLSPTSLVLNANTVADITGAGNLTIGAAITGSGKNLVKSGAGAGKLILTGNNSALTGSVYVNSGIVQAGNTNALGTGATVVTGGATLELSGGISPANALSVTGQGLAAAGAIHNVSGNNTASGTVTLGGDTKIAADSGTTLNLTGNVTGANRNLDLAGAGTINLNQITTGTGGVTIDSTGTVNFNGATTANTYTGLTTVNSGTLVLNKTSGTNAIGAGGLDIAGGTVQLAAGNQIADTASVQIDNAGVFNLNGKAETIAQLNSTSAAATAALGAGGSLTITGAGNLNSAYAGALTGSAASSLNVNSTGKVYLSSASSGFAGTTNVTGGTLNVSGSNAVLGSGAANVSGAGNLQLQGGLNLANAVTLNGSGAAGNGAVENFAGNNTLSGAVTVSGASRVQSDTGTLTVAGNVALGSNTLSLGGAGNTTVSGAIGGSGGLVKDGSGVLTLATANSFTGATSINAGAVIASASNVFNNTSLLTVGAGGSLSLGSFSQNVGALGGAGLVDFGAGGTLNLTGGSATFSGTIAGAGTLVIGPGATLTLGANFNDPNLNITLAGGTLKLSSSSLNFGNLTVTGNSILDFGAPGASSLTANSLSFGSTTTQLTVNNWANTVDYFYAQNFPGATPNARGSLPENQITFTGWSNNNTAWQGYDHQLTPVPEPATYGAIFMGLSLALIGGWKLRRRKSAPKA